MSDLTLRDLHAALTDLLMVQGARMVSALMNKHRIARLADLPAGAYADFMEDVRLAKEAVTTKETRDET